MSASPLTSSLILRGDLVDPATDYPFAWGPIPLVVTAPQLFNSPDGIKVRIQVCNTGTVDRFANGTYRYLVLR